MSVPRITGVDDLQVEILQDIKRMRDLDVDETEDNRSKSLLPLRPTTTTTSISRTKAFRRRYVNMQRELQVPEEKTKRSLSPRLPETSRSAPVDGTDDEAKHIGKQEIQKILNRIRKDREREKRSKEALMRYAIESHVIEIQHADRSHQASRPEEEPPSRTSFNRTSFDEWREKRRSFQKSFDASDDASEITHEEELEWPEGIIKNLITLTIAHAYSVYLHQRLAQQKALIGRRLYAKVVLVRVIRNFIAKARAAALRRKTKRVLGVLRPTIRFIINLRCSIKNRRMDCIKTFFAEHARSAGKHTYMIRKFMCKIKKVQQSLRGYLRIKKARVHALSLYWDRIENHVRAHHKRLALSDKLKKKQLEQQKISEHEKRNRHRHDSVEVKWLQLHRNVIMYDRNITETHAKYKRCAGAKNVADMSKEEDEEDDLLDTAIPHDVKMKFIHDTLLQKKRMHLLNVEMTLDPNAAGNLINESTVSDYLRDKSDSHAKISSIQMMGAESYKARKYNKSFKLNANTCMFRMLTDKSLGESWKSVIKSFIEKDLKKNEIEEARVLAQAMTAVADA